MSVRHLGALVFAVSLAVPSAFAIDSGKAEGSITINGKPVKMKYAFAKKEKDMDEKDRYVVLLTDRAVSRSVLADSMRLSEAVKNGLVVAMLTFDEAKSLSQSEVKSKALKHGGIPMGSDLKMTGLAVGAKSIEGAAATTEDEEFFSDVASMSVKFNAPLGQDSKFGESPAASAELAASRPKVADGAATGSFTLDGKKTNLTHSIARTRPNAFDEKKKDVVVLITNEPITTDLLLDEFKLMKAVESGTLRGLKLTIDDEEQPYHLTLLDPKGFQITGSGFWNLDAYDYSDKHVSAKFFTTETKEFGSGGQKYEYDVTFAVPVQAIKDPSEMTVDASNGTALPAGGGDAGKAYTAFDKAARAGNFNEMKKYASKLRPMPDIPPEDLKEMLEMMKAMRPSKMKVTGGYIDGDHATLSVDAEGPDKSKMKGTVEMTREDGAWKLMKEKWRQ